MREMLRKYPTLNSLPLSTDCLECDLVAYKNSNLRLLSALFSALRIHIILRALCVTPIAEQVNLNIVFGFPGLRLARIAEGRNLNLYPNSKRQRCGVEV